MNNCGISPTPPRAYMRASAGARMRGTLGFTLSRIGGTLTAFTRENTDMMRGPSPQLRAAVAAAKKPTVSDDALDRLRERVRRCRDLTNEIHDGEERIAAAKRELNQITSTELPDMFDEYGVSSVGIPAEGNAPAYIAETKPYYKAQIRDENANEAHAWLDKHGHGDLIKNMFSVEFGRTENKAADKLRQILEKMDVDFTQKKTVPWNTLTAFVKEQIEKHNATLPLDLLGATVGRVVKLKEKK